MRELVGRRGFRCVSRTEHKACEPTTDVFLGDTMGELPLFYAASDVAFVGGSLVRVGGHNLLEPAALGLPVVTGPHVFNAQEIADLFIERGACRMVDDADGLAAAVGDLLADPAAAEVMGGLGRDVVQRNRGALKRLLQLLDPLLDAETGRRPAG